VIMSIARRLFGLQQSRVLEVPREGGTRSAGDELANLRLGRLVALDQRIRAASTEVVDHEFFNPTVLQSQTPLSPCDASVEPHVERVFDPSRKDKH